MRLRSRSRSEATAAGVDEPGLSASHHPGDLDSPGGSHHHAPPHLAPARGGSHHLPPHLALDPAGGSSHHSVVVKLTHDKKRFELRSCHDVPCLVVLFAAIAGMCFSVAFAYHHGDPYRLLYGTDSWGNTCGRRNPELRLNGVKAEWNTGRDLRDLRYLFYYNQASMKGHVRLCVRTCMTQYASLDSADDLRAYYENTRGSFCWYGTHRLLYMEGTSDTDMCPRLPIIKQVNVLNRCMSVGGLVESGGKVVDSYLKRISFMQAQCVNSTDTLTNITRDVLYTWKEILYMSLVSLFISFLAVLLMRFFAYFVIWTMFIIVSAGSVFGAGVLWLMWWREMHVLRDAEEENDDEASRHAIETRARNWLIYAVIATLISIVVLLLMLVMRKRIALVVELFGEAGKAVTKMPLLVLQPVWTLISLGLFGGLCVVGFSFIITAGNPEVSSDGFVDYRPHPALLWWRWVYALFTLWIVQFVFACHGCTVAGAVGRWYFTRHKSELRWPIAGSMKRLVRYHLGSVAFGSLIVALLQLPRFVLMYLHTRVYGRSSIVAHFILKCLVCCFWCLERIIKFINYNAYILIATDGLSFCRAAHRAFTLLALNALRVVAITYVGSFTLFLGKLACVAITLCVSFFLMHEKGELCYIWTPLVCIAIISFLIAHTFLGIYGLAIDTIFLCFCEDCEENDGIARPYYMSKGLMTFVANSAEALRALNQQHRRFSDVRNHSVTSAK